MIIAMADDIRVILIKLADRLHNMRTLCYLGKQKQIQKAKETLEIYAPLAHRLGINSVKWQLEDLAFSTLHPRKYAGDRAAWSRSAAPTARTTSTRRRGFLEEELDKVGIAADITGRAKHFYSIYMKMSRARQGVQRDLRPHRRCASWSTRSRTATAPSASSTRSGSPSRAASRTTSRCPSSTCTSRCTRR